MSKERINDGNKTGGMIDLNRTRILLLIAMISSIVLIVGCSNKNIVTKSETETDTPKEPLGEKYGFTFFDFYQSAQKK